MVIKAILMDFNGVIIDDETIQMEAYREILAEEGVELTEADYFDSLGMDDRTFVHAAFTRKGKSCDDDAAARIMDAKSVKWREKVSARLPLFAGVENFVKKAAGEFTLGIVSMAGRDEIEYVLERSGLAPCFSTIVSSTDVAKCKPDPECYRLGFRRVDSIRSAQGRAPLTHAECLVIEDSPPGVVAARDADLCALGVTNTVDAAALRAAGASAISTDLSDWMPESIRRVFI